MGTGDRQAQVTADEWTDWRQFDFVVFTNDLARKAIIELTQARRAAVRAVGYGFVRIIRQRAKMALVSGLGAAGFGIPPPLLFIALWRFRRSLGGLRRTLEFQHQLHQLFLAQAFKIITIHSPSESEIAGHHKRG